MELPRGLLNGPLPPAPSASHQEGGGAMPHIVRFPIIIESVRYGALMHELRVLGVMPEFVTYEAWNRYREYWASAYFKARFEKASHNRKSKKGCPGTGPSKHTCGTRSFWTYEDVLALDRDQDDEVTLNDVFLHVHTKNHNGVTFIDNRSARFHSCGRCSKGRVYGLGSLAKRKRRYEDPGAKPIGNAPMDVGASTFQAPPPPPPQEHHQHVGMEPARSPQQQHDDDDEDNHDWLDEEHIRDES
ncbi:hypothetical protein Scep_004397 [Stephania cephalantha]|uniref:Uncharacterized protein n=1 Tax=Stephania cephalantha TaxID=152367 RepID=A0AAP0PVE0_9MAGN